jgi:hypothetical protein
MIKLSPRAQAVLDAVDTLYKEEIPHDYCVMAAAIRAAADQTIDAHDGFAGTRIRKKLLAIATELEETQ